MRQPSAVSVRKTRLLLVSIIRGIILSANENKSETSFLNFFFKIVDRIFTKLFEIYIYKYKTDGGSSRFFAFVRSAGLGFDSEPLADLFQP